MKKTKIIALLLVLASVVCVFAGCSKKLYDYDKYADYILLCNTVGLKIKQSDIDQGIVDAYRAKVPSKDQESKTYSDAKDDVLVENGDTLSIDYEGKLDGKAFEGGTQKGASLTIGSGTFIDGFEDGLIGYAIGDTVDLNLTFPNPYKNNPDLAGKDVVFTVKINSIKRTVYPEYTDANVKTYTGYDTIAEFEKETVETVKKNLIWSEFFTQSKVKKYPENELTKYYKASVKSVESTAAMFGYTLETYVKYYYGYSSTAIFYQRLAAQAQAQVKQELLVLAYVEAHPGVALSEEDLEKERVKLYNEYVEENEYDGSYKKFKKEFEDISIKLAIYYDVVVEDLMKTMVITDDVTKNGFVKDRNGVRYYVDDVYRTGWTELDPDGDGTTALYYFALDNGYAPNGCVYLAPKGETEAKYLEFGENGAYVGLYNGKYTDDKGTRYFENGVIVTGWQELDLDSAVEGTEKYYFDTENGYMFVGINEIDGVYYNFGKTGICSGEVSDGLNADDGGTRYFENGALVTGWKELDLDTDIEGNEKYYFDPANRGYMVVNGVCGIPEEYEDENGETKTQDIYYKFDKNGVSQGVAPNGLCGDKNGTRYIENGKLVTGWVETTEFDDVGTLEKYYFDPENNGYMIVNNIHEINGIYEAFDDQGKYLKPYEGPFSDKIGGLRFFDKGALLTGKYVYDPNDNGESMEFYLDPENNGYAYTNRWLVEDGENKYYYDSTGVKVVSKVMNIDGVNYKFDENGNYTVEAE